MKHIDGYNEYNEGIGTYFKSLITGVKTDDDKIAKDILKNIDDVDFIWKPHTGLHFDYNGYRFRCYPGGTCIIDDDVKINSKFLKIVYNRGRDIYYKKEEQDIKRKFKKNSIKVSKYIEDQGGLENLIENYITYLQNVRTFGLDPNDKFKSLSDNGSSVDHYLRKDYDMIVIEGVIGVTKPYVEIRFDFIKKKLKLEFDVNKTYELYLQTEDPENRWLDEHKEWYNYMIKLRDEIIEYNKGKSGKNDIKKKGIIMNILSRK